MIETDGKHPDSRENPVGLTPVWSHSSDSVLIHECVNADGVRGNRGVFNLGRNVRRDDGGVDVGGAQAPMMLNGAVKVGG